jgi:uncharacterized membrane protein YkvA (DUF1232 family)
VLKASSLEVFLTESDIQGALEEYASGKLESLQVELEDGVVVLRVRVVDERLPMAVPVELRVSVLGVRDTQVEAGVSWSNMPLLPGFLKELALHKAFDALPGNYDNGVMTVDVAEVLDNVPVSFRIQGLSVTREGIRVTLADVAAFPFRPAEVVTMQPGAMVPVPSVAVAVLPEHQDYYQKLRDRVKRLAATQAPKWAQAMVPWVLAIPDFFVMMVKLARDERVPTVAKVIAGATIAYFITPIDLIPDVIPFIGQMDDVAVALFAIEQIGQRIPFELIEEAWPGDESVADLVKEGTQLFRRVLPEKMVNAMLRVVNR